MCFQGSTLANPDAFLEQVGKGDIYPKCQLHDTWNIPAVFPFQLQKPFLPPEAPGVAGETAVGADNPVAGEEQGQFVFPHGTPDGLGGHGAVKAIGHVFVGAGLSVGNLPEHFPHLQLKGRAHRMQGRKLPGLLSGKVPVQPPGRRKQVWGDLPLCSEAGLPEPDIRQADFVPCQQNHSQRGGVNAGHCPTS